MTEINLLFRLYFEESKQEGLIALQRVLARAVSADLSIFGGTSRRQVSGLAAQMHVPEPFNVLEGVLMFGGAEGSTPQTEIDVRYRPAISSRLWRKLQIPDPSTSNLIQDPETFQFFLSLIGFEKPAIASGANNAAVLELLCCSISVETTLEKTVAVWLMRLCPELVSRDLWGYADLIPFRQLSVEEEWRVARTDLLWADLAVTSDATHQYLLCSNNSKPSVAVPETGVREGPLTIYKLASLR